MKTEWITMRVSETEKKSLERLKKQSGLSMTEIIRLGISKIKAEDLPKTKID